LAITVIRSPKAGKMPALRFMGGITGASCDRMPLVSVKSLDETSEVRFDKFMKLAKDSKFSRAPGSASPMAGQV
jgi:hypothetical protein